MAVKKFKIGKAMKKGLVAAGAVAVGMAGAVEYLGGLKDPSTVTAIAGVSAVVMGVRVGINWWKINKDIARKRSLL